MGGVGTTTDKRPQRSLQVSLKILEYATIPHMKPLRPGQCESRKARPLASSQDVSSRRQSATMSSRMLKHLTASSQVLLSLHEDFVLLRLPGIDFGNRIVVRRRCIATVK